MRSSKFLTDAMFDHYHITWAAFASGSLIGSLMKSFGKYLLSVPQKGANVTTASPR